MFLQLIILYVFHLPETTGHSQYTSHFIKRRWYCPFKGVPKEDRFASIKCEEQVLADAAAGATNAATESDTDEME